MVKCSPIFFFFEPPPNRIISASVEGLSVRKNTVSFLDDCCFCGRIFGFFLVIYRHKINHTASIIGHKFNLWFSCSAAPFVFNNLDLLCGVGIKFQVNVSFFGGDSPRGLGIPHIKAKRSSDNTVVWSQSKFAYCFSLPVVAFKLQKTTVSYVCAVYFKQKSVGISIASAAVLAVEKHSLKAISRWHPVIKIPI